MSIVFVALGFSMIVVGRQFYGAFVAGVTFITGIWLNEQLRLVEDDLNAMWISLAFAVVFGWATFEMRRWAAGAPTRRPRCWAEAGPEHPG